MSIKNIGELTLYEINDICSYHNCDKCPMSRHQDNEYICQIRENRPSLWFFLEDKVDTDDNEDICDEDYIPMQGLLWGNDIKQDE